MAIVDARPSHGQRHPATGTKGVALPPVRPFSPGTRGPGNFPRFSRHGSRGRTSHLHGPPPGVRRARDRRRARAVAARERRQRLATAGRLVPPCRRRARRGVVRGAGRDARGRAARPCPRRGRGRDRRGHRRRRLPVPRARPRAGRRPRPRRGGRLVRGVRGQSRGTEVLDPESGLATTQYLVHRLRETYGAAERAGLDATRTHGLLVVDVALDDLTGWQRFARSAAMGRALTHTFGEGHPWRRWATGSSSCSASGTRTTTSCAPCSATTSSARASRWGHGDPAPAAARLARTAPAHAHGRRPAPRHAPALTRRRPVPRGRARGPGRPGASAAGR